MLKGKLRTLLCIALLSISASLFAQPAKNVAYQDAEVRFTVISD